MEYNDLQIETTATIRDSTLSFNNDKYLKISSTNNNTILKFEASIVNTGANITNKNISITYNDDNSLTDDDSLTIEDGKLTQKFKEERNITEITITIINITANKSFNINNSIHIWVKSNSEVS